MGRSKKNKTVGSEVKKEFANEQEHWQAYYGDIWEDYERDIWEAVKDELPEDPKE